MEMNGTYVLFLIYVVLMPICMDSVNALRCQTSIQNPQRIRLIGPQRQGFDVHDYPEEPVVGDCGSDADRCVTRTCDFGAGRVVVRYCGVHTCYTYLNIPFWPFTKIQQFACWVRVRLRRDVPQVDCTDPANAEHCDNLAKAEKYCQTESCDKDCCNADDEHKAACLDPKVVVHEGNVFGMMDKVHEARQKMLADDDSNSTAILATSFGSMTIVMAMLPTLLTSISDF